MKFRCVFAVVLFVLAGLQSVSAQSYGAPYSSIECLNVELDGSVTVRVSGEGRNIGDAKEQAKKNAVYNVIFKGIKTQDANSVLNRPLVYEVNAAEKYSTFLYEFFADGGDYIKFVSMEDRRAGSNRLSKKNKQMGWSTTVRVLRPQLEQYLKEKGIIKR